jgi:hypothetical protein
MSHGLLLKKKEQHLQQQLMLQQQQSQHHSFPSPITPTYDRKVFSSPSSSSSSSCRFDSGVSSNGSSATATEVSSSASHYSSSTPASSISSSSTATAAATSSNQRHSSSYGQYPFGDVYSSGNFLNNSYSATALGSHDLTRSSCSALPSPTIYPPTPPPSSTPWLHPAWFGSMEAVGYMKTPKNNLFEN